MKFSEQNSDGLYAALKGIIISAFRFFTHSAPAKQSILGNY